MSNGSPPAPLAADLTQRLTDFARACKGATRAVLLYPDGHPAIRAALDRLVEAARRGTGGGPLTITVLPKALAIDGREAARPDPAVRELAALLHEHLVGELRIVEAADPGAWRTFLLLLGRSTEDLLANGGIGRLWATSGGQHLQLREIDYAEVLRERQSGSAAAWSAIVAHCLAGDAVDLDETTLRTLVTIAADPARLLDLTRQIDEEVADRGVRAQAQALSRLLTELARAVTVLEPERLDLVLRNAAAAAGSLSPDVMLELLGGRPQEPAGGSLDVVGEVVDRMSDATVASFVANSVVAEGGATARLAEAFKALVPEEERRTGILAMASAEVAETPLGREAGFQDLWERTSDMLLSYRDEPFVSVEYARELSRARTQAIEVECSGDDPPDRIAAWLATVTDAAIRHYDLQLLLDLLRIEDDPDRWHEIVEPAVAHVTDLVLLGDLESAVLLVQALATEAGVAGRAARRPIAVAALERLAAGPLMGYLVGHLRTIDDGGFGHARELCHALGSATIRPLAEALVSASQGLAFRRLTELLVSFGSRGRDVIEQLKSSPNPSVRRTAIHLLREFGGRDALPELAPLLDDAEPHVQREAVRAIIRIGTDEAYALLVGALASGSGRSRDAILGTLGSMRDERAVPLFRYLLQNRAYRRTLRPVYEASIEGLGALGGDEALDALKAVLYDGEWWAPLRTAAIRATAAGALRRIGSSDALAILEAAAASGSRGVRAAARQQLAHAVVRQHGPRA